MRAAVYTQPQIRHAVYVEHLGGGKVVHATRGAGGQGMGSHGSLPFDPDRYVHAGVPATSTLSQYKPLLDTTPGVRPESIALLAQLIASDPSQFSSDIMLGIDGISVRPGVIWWRDQWLGTTCRDIVNLDAILGMDATNLANEVIVVMATDLSGKLTVAVAAWPVNGYPSARLREHFLEVAVACQEQGLTVRTVCTDGLSLPGLWLLRAEFSMSHGVAFLVDSPHHLKTLQTVLRNLEEMTSPDGIPFDLYVVLDEKKRGLFEKLRCDVHLNPRDRMAVQPVLDLIGLTTQKALETLGTPAALALREWFALCLRYWDLWDIKRTREDQHNPLGRPVMSLSDRLTELDDVVERMLKVRL